MMMGSYEKLRARFDMFPFGFPKTERGIELKLLEKLFSEEEAEVACTLNLMMTDSPQSAQTIADKMGRDVNEIEAILELMTKKALIYGAGDRGHRVFALLPMIPGVCEFNVDNFDEETARLVEEYLYHDAWGPEMAKAQSALTRIVPVNQSVPSSSIIHSYDDAIGIIKAAKSITVMNCLCRTQKNLIGEGCGRPTETCLSFDFFAEHLISIGKGRALTKEEAIDVITKAADAGCYFSAANINDPVGFCCCCNCCCHLAQVQTLFSMPGDTTLVAKSDFVAAVDLDLCTGCENCIEDCWFHALSMEEEHVVVNSAKCVGCGKCVKACPAEALSLLRKSEEEREPLPNDMVELFSRMGWRK